MSNIVLAVFILLFIYSLFKLREYRIRKMGNSPINVIIDNVYNAWYDKYYWINDKNLTATDVKKLVNQLGKDLSGVGVDEVNIKDYVRLLETNIDIKSRIFKIGKNLSLSALALVPIGELVKNVWNSQFEVLTNFWSENSELIQIIFILLSLILIVILSPLVMYYFSNHTKIYQRLQKKVFFEMLANGSVEILSQETYLILPAKPFSKIDHYIGERLSTLSFVFDMVEKALSKLGKIGASIKIFGINTLDFLTRLFFPMIFYILAITVTYSFNQIPILFIALSITFFAISLFFYISASIGFSKRIKQINSEIEIIYTIKYSGRNCLSLLMLFSIVLGFCAVLNNCLLLISWFIFPISDCILFNFVWKKYIKTEMAEYIQVELNKFSS